MTEVTRIVNAVEQGDAQAAEQLLPLVYDELRHLAAQKLSHEKPGQVLGISTARRNSTGAVSTPVFLRPGDQRTAHSDRAVGGMSNDLSP